jgi:hypothetical protein
MANDALIPNGSHCAPIRFSKTPEFLCKIEDGATGSTIQSMLLSCQRFFPGFLFPDYFFFVTD